MWENRSSVTLIWELPGSAAAAVDTFERDEWKKDWKSDGEIEYDEHEGFESSERKGSEAFDDAGNTIDDYDDFDGGGNTEVVAFGSRGAPWRASPTSCATASARRSRSSCTEGTVWTSRA